MSGWQDEVRRMMKTGDRKGKFKFEEGTNVFRVLPNANETGDVNGSFENESQMIRCYTHRDVGPEKKWIACGKDHSGAGSCWLCDVVIPKLQESGKRSKIALAKLIERKGQWVAQVAYLNESQRWSGPALWYVPGSGGDKSFCYRLMKKLQRKAYTDPVKGFNFTVEREGMGAKDTVYGDIEVDDDPSKVPSSIMKNLKPFSEMLPQYSKELQVAAWKGVPAEEMAAEDDEDDIDGEAAEDMDFDDDNPKPVEDEPPVKPKKGKTVVPAKKSKKPAVVEEDEPEEDEDEVTDVDEEEATDEEDIFADDADETDDAESDDDDLENLEDEEDEPPAKKPKGKVIPPAKGKAKAVAPTKAPKRR